MDEILPADFFLLRTPTLPWNVIDGLGADLEAPRALRANGDVASAIERDATSIRARLRDLVRRPEVRGAISVASPSLDARLGRWLEGDEGEAARSVEPAILRYVMRMAGRATPFGLFAGSSRGRLDDRTALVVPPLVTYERRTRLDLDWLVELADHLAKTPALKRRLRYRANDTVYAAGETLRYYALGIAEGKRAYALCEVGASPVIASLLRRARTESTIDELTLALVASENVEPDEAAAFVERLVETQLLRATIIPPLTGPSPVHHMIETLRSVPEARAVADALEALEAFLSATDAAGLGAAGALPESALSAIHDAVPSFSPEPASKVDLRKPCEGLLLARSVAAEIAAAVGVLARITHEPDQAIERFARDFEARYQEREVSLLEALDPESGVGFDPAPPGTDVSPLLDGLAFEPPRERTVAWRPREELLMARITDALRRGALAIDLSAADIDAIACQDDRDVPPGMNAIVTIAAGSHDALARGEWRMFVQAGGTTTGALLGRFLGEDRELEDEVRALVRREDASAPDAVHAEVAHLPAAHTSNSVCRPVLRDYEIEIGGGSGAPADRRLPVADLLVSVRGRRVRLRSRSLGRRVVPHLSCAHAYETGHAAYRLLASLQEQGRRSHLGWTWGRAFATAPFLPRLTHGRIVLSLARWRVEAASVRAVLALEGPARFVAVQRLREELGLPRLVRLVEGDNVLPVDLDSVLSVDAMLGAVKRGERVTLAETFPLPEELVARGPDGAFHHELVLPLVRSSPRAPVRLVSAEPLAPTPDRARRPGGDWLFAKVYGGIATLDRALVEVIAPFVRAVRADGALGGWFFLRYADPEWHLRLRLHGQAATLWPSTGPRLFEALRRVRGVLHRVTLDTYDPEVERYGGSEGLAVAERIFEADSDAALALIGCSANDPRLRWRLLLLGMDALLDDLGFTLEEKRAIALTGRDTQAANLHAGRALLRRVGEKFRAERTGLERLLARPRDAHPAVADALARRAQRIAPHAARLRELERRGALTATRADVAHSLLHMSANRVLRGSPNAQELVIHDWLGRLYEGRAARRSLDAEEPARVAER